MVYFILVILVMVIILMLNSQHIYRYFDNVQEHKELDFKKRTNLDLYKLTKISPGVTWFGSRPYLYSYPEFYFDNDFLYRINYDQVTKHSIHDITEVSRTAYTINDRRIWRILINESGNQIEYKIATNQSLMTDNFSSFLDKVNQNENAIVDSEWLL